jgi:hypothetical protein
VNSIIEKEDLVKVLNYKSLYSHFEEYAKEFVDRFNKFGSRGYGQNINAIFGDNKTKDKSKTLIDENKLKEFLTDQELKVENIFKYPLTKFKLELYNTVKKLFNNV